MAKKITPAQAAAQLKNQHHPISVEKAGKMAKRFQKFRKALEKALKEGTPPPATTPSLGIAYSFDKKSVQRLLRETDAVGLRIYPAVNDGNAMTMILVAFDANGNNIHHNSLSPIPAAGKKAKAKTALRTETGEDDDDGVLDDGQANPPYPTPDVP